MTVVGVAGRAYVRRALPLHGEGTAAARRGVRWRAAEARSGRVDVGTMRALEPCAVCIMRKLWRAFYLTRGFAAG